MSENKCFVVERNHPVGMGSTQKIYRFANGYGASVVSSPFSYGGDRGLWELAVIKFGEETSDSFKLVYDTPVTNDVEGFLSLDAVDSLLEKIKSLPSANGNCQ